MKVEASAPSNIALIKYMGKSASFTNFPVNASLSYSLDHLRSFVTIEERDADADAWQPLRDLPELKLSAAGQKKFIAFFEKLKQRWNINGHFTLASANNFPADCGLASSASSFAALTLAGYELAKRANARFELSAEELSKVARLGSGSSCRSLFSPWALWRADGAEAVNLKLRLEHAVVIVEDSKKLVSSTEAHARVNSSLLFGGRPERAEERLKRLLATLAAGEWRDSFELCWSEFWDMHALFESSVPSFGYLCGDSLEVLNHLRKVWRETGDGPLVTMDAGANVHLLLRADQCAQADVWLKDWKSLKSWSSGAEL